MIKIWGKVIGAVLGFAAGGGPMGAIVGMAAGHAFDQRAAMASRRAGFFAWDNLKAAPQRNVYGAASQQAVYTNGVIALGAKLAKVDGRVTRAKIDAFKRAFQIKPADEARVGRMFDTARRSVDGFEAYAFSLSQSFVSHPAILEDILVGLLQVAAAGGERISPAAGDYLRRVAFAFNFGPEVFQRLVLRANVKMPSEEQARAARREVKRDGASDPYAILGIADKASNDDVKLAYRNLIRKHHPDKLIAEGGSPEFIATANEKMKRINVAYDTVCKMRGIK